MIDPTTEANDVEAQDDNKTAERAAYEAKAADFLEEYDDLSWSERRELHLDDDGDLNLADNNLPSDLLVLEDFHQEFIYQVKAAEHLADYDEDQAMKVWSNLVRDHVAAGNNKITKTTAIFNMNSAGDCPNRQTERCQVAWSQCYAHNAEDLRTRKRDDGRYVGPLVARRRQEFLRDCMDAETFARAFIRMNSRKRTQFDTLRVSEAGDFRDDADIKWVNKVAEILKREQGITTYTYSASSDLNWDLAEHFTVNASNDFTDYGDSRFKARDPSNFELDDDERWCPNDLQKVIRRLLGDDFDDVVKCGECRLCVDKNDIDVVIPIHADGVEKLTLDDIRDHISDDLVAEIEAHQAETDA